jgi:hypothetical protein
MARVLSALVLTALAACAAEDPTPTFGAGLGTPDNPIPANGASYAVRSLIAPSTTTLPAAVTSVTSPLHGFATAPAHTLLGLAQTANVPELAQLTAALPATLSPKLEGWIDAEIDKGLLVGKTARQYVTDMAGFAETVLTQFGVESTLTFTPAKTTHTLDALTFRLAGYEVVVPLGGLTADVVEQHPEVTIAEAGAITFGDHHFGLAFGNHAWQGVNLASNAAYNADMRTALGTAINCHAVAVAVAAKCVGTSCVGHTTQLEAVCTQGLDLLVNGLETRVAAFDFGVLRYVSGSARLVDTDLDGLANRIENGIWNPEMNVGPASATFTASVAR